MADVYMEMEQARAAASVPAHEAAASLPPPSDIPTKLDKKKKNRGFRAQWHAFTTMALPYFYDRSMARVLFGVMIVLTLLNSGVGVVFSYLVRDFWSALSENRQDEFYVIMRNFVIALILLAPIHVYYRYQRQTLAIHWREWMTDRVLKLYASNHVYYGIERLSSSDYRGEPDDKDVAPIDNPDQRITEDVRSFTEYSLTLFLTVLMAVVDLMCFSVILFTIMPQLFLAIVLFATFGTVMTILIGRVLVQLNFEKLQKEADFRYSLVRLRENAESIAFLSGEPSESRQVGLRLARVIANMHSINVALRNLDFFTTYYTYLTWILPILVVAPDYFAGSVELGVVQQAAASFSHVLDDLSILVTQWESLSEFSAGIDRLFTFLNAMQQLDPDRPPEAPLLTLREKKPSMESWQPPRAASSPWSYHQYAGNATTIDLQQLPPILDTTSTHAFESNKGGGALTVTNLCITTPNHDPQRRRELIRHLSLSVQWGENLLIVGASGTGKSSLLRAIAGLWNTGSGSIQRPSDQDIYFLPQKPYCSTGSLRDQLLYPSTTDWEDRQPDSNDGEGSSNRAHVLRRQRLSDDDLLGILRAVDLAELPQRAGNGNAIQGLDAVLDWSNMLSLGEQQRLAFGRILVNQPRFVIMDESTSALDVDSESRMYALLRDMARTDDRKESPAALTYVSVGHRPTLLAHHDTKLILSGDHCSVEPIQSSSSSGVG